MKCPCCKKTVKDTHFACKAGAKGGSKSRRKLTPAQARAMVKAREDLKKPPTR
jgi:hypothetical protein